MIQRECRSSEKIPLQPLCLWQYRYGGHQNLFRSLKALWSCSRAGSGATAKALWIKRFHWWRDGWCWFGNEGNSMNTEPLGTQSITIFIRVARETLPHTNSLIKRCSSYPPLSWPVHQPPSSTGVSPNSIFREKVDAGKFLPPSSSKMASRLQPLHSPAERPWVTSVSTPSHHLSYLRGPGHICLH